MTAEPMKPTQLLTTTLGFTEKVLASQQDFTTKLFEAVHARRQGGDAPRPSPRSSPSLPAVGPVPELPR